MDTLYHEFIKASFKPDPRMKAASHLGARLANYRHTMQNANRFVLSNKALEEIVVRATTDSEAVEGRVPLAWLPFDTVWIEYDNHHRVKTQHAVSTSDLPDADTPKKAGFLLRRLGRASAWHAQKMFDPTVLHGLTPLGYLFDAESEAPIKELGYLRSFTELDPHETLTDDYSDAQMFASFLMWGYNINSPQASKLASKMEILRNKAVYCKEDITSDFLFNQINAGILSLKKVQDVLASTARENAGDLRFLVTLLSVINEVPMQYDYVPPKTGSYLAGGKLQPYMSHRTISIDLNKMKRRSVLKILQKAAEKAEKRRHKVRGHWRVIFHKAAHTRKIKRPDGSLMCREIPAGEERVWVTDHERGNAAIGFVTTDYEVVS